MARYSDDMPSWYIDAKELWKMLIQQREKNKKLSCAFTVNAGINQAVGLMNSLPAAEVVEVVHAYWIGDEPGDWHCSHCGKYAADGGFEQTRYCPHCGSIMDGERKDNG